MLTFDYRIAPRIPVARIVTQKRPSIRPVRGFPETDSQASPERTAAPHDFRDPAHFRDVSIRRRDRDV
jgi:hypothetical protein